MPLLFSLEGSLGQVGGEERQGAWRSSSSFFLQLQEGIWMILCFYHVFFVVFCEKNDSWTQLIAGWQKRKKKDACLLGTTSEKG